MKNHTDIQTHLYFTLKEETAVLWILLEIQYWGFQIFLIIVLNVFFTHFVIKKYVWHETP